jgi:glutathione S-transferase
MGTAFSLTDCAALPPLFYANMIEPFGKAHRNLKSYFDRLKTRPSIARVMNEAGAVFQYGPERRVVE